MTGVTRSLSLLVPADGGYTFIPELNKETMRQLQDESVIRLLIRHYLPEAKLLNIANKTVPSTSSW